jgi:hypothetical protein
MSTNLIPEPLVNSMRLSGRPTAPLTGETTIPG